VKVFIVIEVPEVPDVDSALATEIIDDIQATLKHFPYSWFIDDAVSTPEEEVDTIAEAALKAEVEALVSAHGLGQFVIKDPT
jgi:hypothetical protein